MCQYDCRCSVGRHRVSTACRYTSRFRRINGRIPASSTSSNARRHTATNEPHTGHRQRRLIGATAVPTAVLVAFASSMAWAAIVDASNRQWTPQWLLTAWLSLILPLFAGSALTQKCGAWLRDGGRRCERTRRGLGKRCQDHRGATATDLACASIWACSLINLLVTWPIIAAAPLLLKSVLLN